MLGNVTWKVQDSDPPADKPPVTVAGPAAANAFGDSALTAGLRPAAVPGLGAVAPGAQPTVIWRSLQRLPPPFTAPCWPSVQASGVSVKMLPAVVPVSVSVTEVLIESPGYSVSSVRLLLPYLLIVVQVSVFALPESEVLQVTAPAPVDSFNDSAPVPIELTPLVMLAVKPEMLPVTLSDNRRAAARLPSQTSGSSRRRRRSRSLLPLLWSAFFRMARTPGQSRPEDPPIGLGLGCTAPVLPPSGGYLSQHMYRH